MNVYDNIRSKTFGDNKVLLWLHSVLVFSL